MTFNRDASKPCSIWQHYRPADRVGESLVFPPSRIVCLTEETVETLYLLGEQDRIVGISGYVVRPRRRAVKSRA